VGFIALTDAAPLIVAQELGLFARHDLRVDLRREIGWATIREKIIYGELEASHAPAPMLWATQLGLGSRPCEVLTAHVLNLNGNALTLSRALWDAGVRDAATLRQHIRERRGQEPITLGVVFLYSFHHLMIRSWLLSAGIQPDQDVRIVVVPPAQMFRNLAAGTIDGYCVGDPWNSLAVREGIGWCPLWSTGHQPGHAEKVIMVTRRFAEERADAHAALIAALVDASIWCDEPQNRDQLATILSRSNYLNLPARVISPALQGKFDTGQGRIEQSPDFILFHRQDANVPTAARAQSLHSAMSSAGLLPAAAAADTTLPGQLFREDLHRSALQNQHLTTHA
jgi:ABC-type nitrate/sulfonate/bicarbonate transport system substrate-binding protein